MTGSPKDRLEALRTALKDRGGQGYLIPRADEYLGEYVPACAERLSWLTGFSGSAGMAVVLQDRAALFTDGRYDIQARREVDEALYDVTIVTKAGMLKDWLAEHAPKNSVLFYDPGLFTREHIKAYEESIEATFRPLDENLVDLIWPDRPSPPDGEIILFPDSVAGKTAAEKREQIAKTVKEAEAGAVLLAAPEAVAWLLNIRGTDVPRTPLSLSRVILYAGGKAEWFIDKEKVSESIQKHLGKDVVIKDPASLTEHLKILAGEKKPVLIDFKRTPVRFQMIIEDAGGTVTDSEDPCLVPRACKTEAEQNALIETHKRDGVAVVRLLKWFEEEAPKGNLTELDVVRQLRVYREKDPAFQDDSFDTIAGWNANGAIIHYRPEEETNLKIVSPGLLLLDSGGQYLSEDCAGTTDITRTIAVGAPNDEQKKMFTLVLKGHIALACARFPEGLAGRNIDMLTRQFLYAEGYDYMHGTGHGVGCYLSVHEEAAHIDMRSERPFKEGMLISNEPGYYKEGAYGIRTESLILASAAGTMEAGERSMLRFETVTLAPIDKTLVVTGMMTESEKDWLNAYHTRVYDTLAPRLTSEERDWLKAATAKI